MPQAGAFLIWYTLLNMNIKKGEWLLILFNAIYAIAFTIYYLRIQNFEFLWYVAVFLFFFGLIVFTIHKSNFDYVILWGLSLWGFMHMSGGGVIVNGDVLYRLILFPIIDAGDFVILRFDQFVHFFGFAIATLAVYHLLKPYLNEKTNWKVIYLILAAAGTGLGVLNELVEFVAVVAFSETGVGGYYNTALDLLFNALGAIAATVFIAIRRKGRRNLD